MSSLGTTSVPPVRLRRPWSTTRRYGAMAGLASIAFVALGAAVLLHALPLLPTGLSATVLGWGTVILAAVHLLGLALLFGVMLVLLRTRGRVVDDLDVAVARARVSETRLRTLFDSTADGIASVDRELRITALNSPFRAFFRDTVGERPALHDALLDLMPADRRERWEQRLERVLAGERCEVTEVFQVLEERRFLEIVLAPIVLDGRVIGASFVGRDATNRFRADEERKQMHRRMMDLSREAGMAQVATGVLHDVGNALNSVNVASSRLEERLDGLKVDRLGPTAELLAQESADDTTRRVADYLGELGRHLEEGRQGLREDLAGLDRDVARIRDIVRSQQQYARRVGLHEVVSLREVISQAVDEHRPALEEAGIELYQRYADLPPARADRHKLTRVVDALLSNALRAVRGASEPRIAVELRREHDRVQIAVIDNGAGIAPEHRDRIFEHGFSTTTGGAGFGLHEAANLAREMEGELACRSPGVGQGSTFTLTVPLEVPGGNPLWHADHALQSFYG